MSDSYEPCAGMNDKEIQSLLKEVCAQESRVAEIKMFEIDQTSFNMV